MAGDLEKENAKSEETVRTATAEAETVEAEMPEMKTPETAIHETEIRKIEEIAEFEEADEMDREPVIHPSVYIAPGAFVRGDVTLAENVNIWHNAVLHGNPGFIRVGKNTSIQEVTVFHAGPGSNVVVGENVNIGHACIIHGCTIEDLVTVGMGSIIMDGAVIGTGSFIGAGSLVTANKKIPPNSLVMGSPARVIGEATEEMHAQTLDSIRYYQVQMEKEKRRARRARQE